MKDWGRCQLWGRAKSILGMWANFGGGASLPTSRLMPRRTVLPRGRFRADPIARVRQKWRICHRSHGYAARAIRKEPQNPSDPVGLGAAVTPPGSSAPIDKRKSDATATNNRARHTIRSERFLEGSLEPTSECTGHIRRLELVAHVVAKVAKLVADSISGF
ncbi:hypothetical protein M569_17481 [Genlisea aurea]|uniref:Uncharacterized protein n=1 Tax=Genlisea aurea TaxID=192259 RepID=S8DDG1_9LAMI|nr:hypothetical protein M569_17481 [Genlisea aurea]